MAMKYRKKPVVVEAVQWTGKNLQELKNFVGDSLEYDVMGAAWEVGKGPVIVNVRIQTLEGIHYASVGDFIIKGIRGEFYPCKPDIFAKTYESATLTPPNEPLTIEELREMDGEPVWLDDEKTFGILQVWDDNNVDAVFLNPRGCIRVKSVIGKKIYRRPPEGEANA